jgi:hypothetical protein
VETAREQRCMVMAATHDKQVIDGTVGKEMGDHFLNNLTTRLYFNNQDKTTNELMRDSLGMIEMDKEKYVFRSGKQETHTQKTKEYLLPYEAALNLKTGGKKCKSIVTGILTRGGESLDGRRCRKVTFHQDKLDRKWTDFLNDHTGVTAIRRPVPDFRYLR